MNSHRVRASMGAPIPRTSVRIRPLQLAMRRMQIPLRRIRQNFSSKDVKGGGLYGKLWWREADGARFGGFIGFITNPSEWAHIRPVVPEAVVFAFVHPRGHAFHRRLIARNGSLFATVARRRTPIPARRIARRRVVLFPPRYRADMKAVRSFSRSTRPRKSTSITRARSARFCWSSAVATLSAIHCHRSMGRGARRDRMKRGIACTLPSVFLGGRRYRRCGLVHPHLHRGRPRAGSPGEPERRARHGVRGHGPRPRRPLRPGHDRRPAALVSRSPHVLSFPPPGSAVGPRGDVAHPTTGDPPDMAADLPGGHLPPDGPDGRPPHVCGRAPPYSAGPADGPRPSPFRPVLRGPVSTRFLLLHRCGPARRLEPPDRPLALAPGIATTKESRARRSLRGSRCDRRL